MDSRALPWLTLSLILLVMGCSDDDPTTPRDTPRIQGTVTDSQGNPVPGAGIVLEYEPPILARPTTQVTYHTAEPGHLLIYTTAQCSEDTLAVLLDAMLEAGTYAVTWDARAGDGRRVPDGLYTVHAVTDLGHDTREIMLFLGGDYPDDALPADWVVLELTSDVGGFTLDLECLPFGHVETVTDGNGDPLQEYTVPHRVRVHALHRDHPTAVSEWVDVDPEAGCRVDFSFPVVQGHGETQYLEH